MTSNNILLYSKIRPKLPPAGDWNKYRDPKPETMHRMRDL